MVLRQHRPRSHDAKLPPVVLWLDTFSNYFLPGTLKAAVAVLEDAGYRVLVPPNLLAGDPDAELLSQQSKAVCELLVDTPDWRPPPLRRKAMLHLHCQMGLDLEQPPVGCCGHAGSFGYEAEHHPVSMQIAEQVLLPALRKTAPETIVIADGFSCRQQIKDGAQRWAMHPAEIIALALDARRNGIPETIPERRYLEPPALPPKGAALAAAAGIGLVLSMLVWHRRARR